MNVELLSAILSGLTLIVASAVFVRLERLARLEVRVEHLERHVFDTPQPSNEIP